MQTFPNCFCGQRTISKSFSAIYLRGPLHKKNSGEMVYIRTALIKKIAFISKLCTWQVNEWWHRCNSYFTIISTSSYCAVCGSPYGSGTDEVGGLSLLEGRALSGGKTSVTSVNWSHKAVTCVCRRNIIQSCGHLLEWITSGGKESPLKSPSHVFTKVQVPCFFSSCNWRVNGW